MSKKTKLLLVVTTVGCVGIVSTSSYLNAMAMYGSAARERQMVETVDQYAEALDQSERRALKVAQLAPDIEKIWTRYDEMATLEFREGMLTGSPGPGATYATLKQVATDIGSLHEAIEESGRENDYLVAKAQKHLSAMRERMHGQGNIQKRVNEFAARASALDSLIAKQNEQSVIQAIRRTAENLGKTLVKPAGSKNAVLKKRQDEVITNIRQALDATGQELLKAAKEIESIPPVDSPDFKPMPASIAVLAYIDRFAGPAAAAIGIDLLPLLLLMFALIASESSRMDDLDNSVWVNAMLDGNLAEEFKGKEDS